MWLDFGYINFSFLCKSRENKSFIPINTPHTFFISFFEYERYFFSKVYFTSNRIKVNISIDCYFFIFFLLFSIFFFFIYIFIFFIYSYYFIYYLLFFLFTFFFI